MALAIGVAAGLHPTQPVLGGGPQTKIIAKEFTFSPKTITAPSGSAQFVVTNAGTADAASPTRSTCLNAANSDPSRSCGKCS